MTEETPHKPGNDLPKPTAGRPRKLDDAKAVRVYLDAATLARAAELGNGNVSEGIRIALKSDSQS